MHAQRWCRQTCVAWMSGKGLVQPRLVCGNHVKGPKERAGAPQRAALRVQQPQKSHPWWVAVRVTALLKAGVAVLSQQGYRGKSVVRRHPTCQRWRGKAQALGSESIHAVFALRWLLRQHVQYFLRRAGFRHVQNGLLGLQVLEQSGGEMGHG